MSENLHTVEQLTPRLEELKILASDPNIVSDDLRPHLPKSFPDSTNNIADSWSPGTRTGQELIGVVSAGDEVFGIVRVNCLGDRSNVETGFVLTRFKDEGRAELVGIIKDDEPLVIGRSELSHLDPTTSRQHFKVKRLKGVIIVEDVGSTNGTTLFRKVSSGDKHHSNQFAVGSLSRQIGVKPFGNTNMWAPQSQVVKNSLNTSNNRTALGFIDAEQKIIGSTDEYYDDVKVRIAEMIKKNPEEEALINEVIVEDKFHGKDLGDMYGSWGSTDRLRRAERFLNLYFKNPELAKAISALNIQGFHASQSGSLPGVLQKGLMSSKALRENEALMAWGEKTFSKQGGQDSISFADWRIAGTIRDYMQGNDQPLTAEQLSELVKKYQEAYKVNLGDYGENHPYTYNSQNHEKDIRRLVDLHEENPNDDTVRFAFANFPVAYGVDISSMPHPDSINEAMQQYKDSKEPVVSMFPRSHIRGEFMVIGERVAVDLIKIIAVPRERIEEVRSYIKANGGGAHIKVFPIEDLV